MWLRKRLLSWQLKEELKSSFHVCVSFLQGNIFISSLSKCLCSDVSPAFLCIYWTWHEVNTGISDKEKKKKWKNPAAFQQVYKRTSLMSCSGIHVCFLCLTCIQTQLFGNWTEEQAPAPDGVAERNVTGKYGRAAQSATWTEAFGRWAMTSLRDSSNAGCGSRCDATRWGSTTEDAHSKWQGEHRPRQQKTRRKEMPWSKKESVENTDSAIKTAAGGDGGNDENHQGKERLRKCS